MFSVLNYIQYYALFNLQLHHCFTTIAAYSVFPMLVSPLMRLKLRHHACEYLNSITKPLHRSVKCIIHTTANAQHYTIESLHH